MNKKLILFGLATVMLAACGGADEADPTGDEEESSEPTCIYTYDHGTTVLTWTAFKLTEKTGVNGTFEEINVTAEGSYENMFDVLSGATFDIPVSSLNSQDDIRDPKIKSFFFGNMAETSAISGSMLSVTESGATVSITMNGTAVEYDGKISVKDETVTFTTTIDITDFEAQIALDSLGEACAEKHTGEDGLRKFWTDVDIAVKTTLAKDCPE